MKFRVKTFQLSTPFAVLLAILSGATAIAGVGTPEKSAAPALSFAPKQLTFSPTVFGAVGATSAFKKITLSNKSKAAVTLTGFAPQGDFAVDSKDTSCGSSLDPGAKCTIAVTFTPKALGPRSGQLSIANSAAGPLLVPLKGTGAPPSVRYRPNTLSFAGQTIGTTSPPQDVTVTNSSPVPVSIVAVRGQGDFVIDSRSCGSALASGANCSIALRFAPSAAGQRTGNLLVGVQNVSKAISVALKGKGLAGACQTSKPNSCNGACTDFSTDANNCGGCGNVCPGTCANGQCQAATVACGLDTPNLCSCGSGTVCTDFLSDPNNCGGCNNACLVGQTCRDGVCAGCTSSGAPDQCGGLCTNLQSDPLNCGGCGSVCSSGQCLQGQCLTCPAGEPNRCGGQCTNALTDANNCGGCGNTCPMGTTCQQGQCAGIVCATETPNQCGGQCTDFTSDPNNCGACGKACPVGGACVQGQCLNCAATTPNQCGTVCTDFLTDSSNCGGCGSVCPSGSTCSGGRCVGQACAQIPAASSRAVQLADSDLLFSGAKTKSKCPDPNLPDSCNGQCTNIQDDPFNCGGCNKPFCSLGQCTNKKCKACSEKFPNVCNGLCVDLDSDPNNCGACGRSCGLDVAGLQVACAGGECADNAICGGAGTNTNEDSNNCGGCSTPGNPNDPHVCKAGFCLGGQCKTVQDCPANTSIVNFKLCGGVCVDVLHDSNNCSDCGKACLENQYCNAVSSGVGCNSCSSAAMPDECPGFCTNLNADPKNCGACGHACGPNEVCTIEGCIGCGEGKIRCGNNCIDPNSDPDNCGACGGQCGPTRFCFQGGCAPCPPLAPTQCDNVCTDTQRDANNCLACGEPCDVEAGEKCISGKCQGCATTTGGQSPQAVPQDLLFTPSDLQVCTAPCADPTPNSCGNLCVNFSNDPNNCGGCGNVCSSGVCSAGQCAPGLCGAYQVTLWSGTVTETAVAGSTISGAPCGGNSGLSLDTTLDSTLHLTPSVTVSGGCDVMGTLNLVQSGSICGVWGGPWMCTGAVDASGNIGLDCTCNTDMSVGGTFQTSKYTGGWSFSASGTDDNGNTVTDDANGTFELDAAAPGAASSAMSVPQARSNSTSMRLHLDR